MIHIVGDKNIFCPFCDEPMQKTKVNVGGQIFAMVFCRTDKIFCYEVDPAFNKWRDTDKHIACPNCATPMRWFARYLDGYMKMQCPGCGMGYEKNDGVEVSKGQIELPDFQENQPDGDAGGEVLYVPIDKMKISEDKKREFKQKLQKRKEQNGGK